MRAFFSLGYGLGPGPGLSGCTSRGLDSVDEWVARLWNLYNTGTTVFVGAGEDDVGLRDSFGLSFPLPFGLRSSLLGRDHRTRNFQDTAVA